MFLFRSYTILLLKMTLVVVAILFSVGSFSFSHAGSFSDTQKADIEVLIKDYITANPGVIMESLEAYRTEQQRAYERKMEKAVNEYLDDLIAEDAPTVGPQDAAVTVIEFFDYNCGYCKRALSDIQQAVNENDDVRFIFREMPILAESSRQAALWALAAHKQDKYFEYHSALMTLRGSKDEATFKNIGRELGLDVDQLEKDSQSDAVKAILDEDIKMAREIGVQGTPAFIINGRVYRGYLGPDGLSRAIREARDTGGASGNAG